MTPIELKSDSDSNSDLEVCTDFTENSDNESAYSGSSVGFAKIYPASPPYNKATSKTKIVSKVSSKIVIPKNKPKFSYLPQVSVKDPNFKLGGHLFPKTSTYSGFKHILPKCAKKNSDRKDSDGICFQNPLHRIPKTDKGTEFDLFFCM